MIKHTPLIWNLNLNEFQTGEWGSALGKFKVPASYIKRFRKLVQDSKGNNPQIGFPEIGTKGKPGYSPATQGYTPEDKGYIETSEFDVVRFFNEMCTTYVNAIVAAYEVVRQSEFVWLELDTKHNLRMAVYNAIEFSLLNRQVWENVNGSSITTPNFTITQEQTNWLLTQDMLGMKAHNYLTAAGLEDYELISQNNLMSLQNDSNGHIRIIGKIDLDKFPELQ